MRKVIFILLILSPAWSLAVSVGGYKYEKAETPSAQTRTRDKKGKSARSSQSYCSISSVHNVMSRAYRLAKKHLRDPKLYAITLELDGSWTIDFIDADSDPGGEVPKEGRFLKDPDSFRYLSHLNGITSYEINTDSYEKWTYHRESQEWLQESSGPRKVGDYDCARISGDFMDSLELQGILDGLDLDLCATGSQDFRLSLFNPGDSKSCRLNPYCDLQVCILSKNFSHIVGRLTLGLSSMISNRNIWAFSTVNEVLFLDAASGEALYQSAARQPEEPLAP